MCTHFMTCAASEYSAKEIGEKRVTALQPVFGLHQGLWNNKLSPLAEDYFILTVAPALDGVP